MAEARSADSDGNFCELSVACFVDIYSCMRFVVDVCPLMYCSQARSARFGLVCARKLFLGASYSVFLRSDDNCHAVIAFVVTVPFVFARNSFLPNLNEASLSCLPGKKLFYDSDDCLQISTVTLLSTCLQYVI